MSTPVNVDIHVMIPFDQDLFTEKDVLGIVMAIGLPSARLELPRDVAPGAGTVLQSPPSSPDEIKKYLPDGEWGMKRDAIPKVAIKAVLIVVTTNAELDFDLAGNQIGGTDVTALIEKVTNWFDSFSHWLWVLTAQSLDPIYPDPKILHRRSRGLVIWGASEDRRSLPASASPTIRITLDDRGPASERSVDRQVLQAAVAAAGTAPPLMLELLASARMAARRMDHRRCLIDAGTAVESALVILLGLAPTHAMTLGSLVYEAYASGFPIPTDTQTALVEPRNDAVHRGTTSGADIGRALEVAETIIALAEPTLIRSSSLTAVNRPQRHDMMVIKPRSDSSSASGAKPDPSVGLPETF